MWYILCRGRVRVKVMTPQKHKDLLSSVSRCCWLMGEVDIYCGTAEVILFPQQNYFSKGINALNVFIHNIHPMNIQLIWKCQGCKIMWHHHWTPKGVTKSCRGKYIINEYSNYSNALLVNSIDISAFTISVTPLCEDDPSLSCMRHK